MHHWRRESITPQRPRARLAKSGGPSTSSVARGGVKTLHERPMRTSTYWRHRVSRWQRRPACSAVKAHTAPANRPSKRVGAPAATMAEGQVAHLHRQPHADGHPHAKMQRASRHQALGATAADPASNGLVLQQPLITPAPKRDDKRDMRGGWRPSTAEPLLQRAAPPIHRIQRARATQLGRRAVGCLNSSKGRGRHAPARHARTAPRRSKRVKEQLSGDANEGGAVPGPAPASLAPPCAHGPAEGGGPGSAARHARLTPWRRARPGTWTPPRS